MKVLCIDDNKEITDLCKTVITSKGYTCEITNDGKEGLKLIKNKNHDVVLLDLAMPGFTGEDIIKNLLKEGPIDDYNIYFFTASLVTEKGIYQYLDLGVKGYIRKPLRLEALLSILQKHET